MLVGTIWQVAQVRILQIPTLRTYLKIAPMPSPHATIPRISESWNAYKSFLSGKMDAAKADAAAKALAKGAQKHRYVPPVAVLEKPPVSVKPSGNGKVEEFVEPLKQKPKLRKRRRAE